jgi:hypothetical protein
MLLSARQQGSDPPEPFRLGDAESPGHPSPRPEGVAAPAPHAAVTFGDMSHLRRLTPAPYRYHRDRLQMDNREGAAGCASHPASTAMRTSGSRMDRRPTEMSRGATRPSRARAPGDGPGVTVGVTQDPPLAISIIGAYALIAGESRRDDMAPTRADLVDTCNNLTLCKVRTSKNMARHPGRSPPDYPSPP